MELRDHFDQANDGGVEKRQILRRNPVLRVRRSTDDLRLMALEKRGADPKPCHVAAFTVASVPVARDLHRVVLIHDWIEDRLFRKTGWKSAVCRLADQHQFLLADRPKQNHDIFSAVFHGEWADLSAKSARRQVTAHHWLSRAPKTLPGMASC